MSHIILIKTVFLMYSRPGSSVGIATGYRLDGPRNRIPVGGDISATVQTFPGAHTASCTTGTYLSLG